MYRLFKVLPGSPQWVGPTRCGCWCDCPFHFREYHLSKSQFVWEQVPAVTSESHLLTLSSGSVCCLSTTEKEVCLCHETETESLDNRFRNLVIHSKWQLLRHRIACFLITGKTWEMHIWKLCCSASFRLLVSVNQREKIPWTPSFL